MAASFASETVGLDAPSLRRHLPLPFDPAVLLQPVQRGKQRSRLDVKRSSRCLEDAFGDSSAVERLQFERPQDEQIERTLDERRNGGRYE